MKDDIPAIEDFILWVSKKNPKNEEAEQALTDYIAERESKKRENEHKQSCPC